MEGNNMKTEGILIIVAFVFLATSVTLAEQAVRNSDIEKDGDYKLVWADEFNKDGPPDPCNWTYERGFVRNQELQW